MAAPRDSFDAVRSQPVRDLRAYLQRNRARSLGITVGYVALDSKWCNEVTADLLDRIAHSARSAARRAESVMRSENIGAMKREARAKHRVDGSSYRVRPVVVVWGAESHKMPSAITREDVECVAGLNLTRWLRSLEGEWVDEATAGDLLKKLADFRRR